MKYLHIGRMLLTAALLWVVWAHVHWSAALCLTLMSISHEITAFAMRKMAEAVKWPKVG